MKHELDNKFYDNAYLSANSYKNHYKKSPYFGLWGKVVEIINNSSIADFGCGVGQFAQMVIDNGIDYRYGVDFSKVAIDECKKIDDQFYCLDLYDDVYEITLRETIAPVIKNPESIVEIELIHGTPPNPRIKTNPFYWPTATCCDNYKFTWSISDSNPFPQWSTTT